MATPKKTPAKKTSAAPKRQLGLEAQSLQRTSASEWLLKSQGETVEVPSGNVAVLRRPGPEMFFRGGLVPDALSGIVDSAIRDKQGLPPEKTSELANDPAMFPKMLMMIDSAVAEACVEPRVRSNPSCINVIPHSSEICQQQSGADVHSKKDDGHFHTFIEGDRIEPDERDPMFLYCSEVDFTDKVFIFQYAAGGSRDLERFRSEYGELMDGLSTVPDSPK